MAFGSHPKARAHIQDAGVALGSNRGPTEIMSLKPLTMWVSGSRICLSIVTDAIKWERRTQLAMYDASNNGVPRILPVLHAHVGPVVLRGDRLGSGLKGRVGPLVINADNPCLPWTSAAVLQDVVDDNARMEDPGVKRGGAVKGTHDQSG